jgi:5'-3' exonuclease
MGIPSYYKKLADHIKGLLSKSIQGTPSALYFDFNCMIYHVARRPNSTLPPYPGLEGKEEWEKLLLEDIVKYVVKVWQAVGSPKEVFLAVDGVVPMAKIKQQRLRRFKSVWLANEEIKEGIRENKPSWDTNCITPGTEFMKQLTLRLDALCKKHAHWSVSGPDEPGEGEHKVMAKLRAREASSEPIVVYGLDADLILLTLLNSKSPAYLVREDSDLGIVQLNSFGEEDYTFFSIETLKQTLPKETDIVNYVAAMSFLGNDFLPHSLTFKLKQDGHRQLIALLKQLPCPLVQETEGLLTINHEAALFLVQELAKEEDARFLQTVKKKFQMRGQVQQSLDTKPIEWMVEKDLAWKDGEGWHVNSAWKEVYTREWLQCSRHQDVSFLCQQYLYGLQWVLDYYTGQRPVPMTWCFPRLIPPLWCQLEGYLQRELYEEPEFLHLKPIQPSEQLAMVLPLESWHLIQDPSLRCLPSQIPHFWPTSFAFFSAGRLHLWECEPLLPSLPIERIRDAAK